MLPFRSSPVRAAVVALAVVAGLVACGAKPKGEASAPAPAADASSTAAEASSPAADSALPDAASVVVITLPEDAAAAADATAKAADAALAQARGATSLRVRSLERDQPSGFETMTIASFADGSAVRDWQRGAGASLAPPLSARAASVLTANGSPAPAPSKSVFKISYYVLTSPLGEFRGWVDGYLTKYLESQRNAGILTSYAMYLEAGEGGRALLVLEYPDASIEKAAEPRKEKLSEELAKNDPEYARQQGLKESLRTTQSWTLAVPVP